MTAVASHVSANARRGIRRSLIGAIATALALAAGLVATILYDPKTQTLVSTGIGCFVGAVELMARYRHAPTRSVTSGGALAYISINSMAAGTAFHFISPLEFIAKNEHGTYLHAFVAGLGAMVILRAALFRVRINDSEVGIGPSAILDTMLMIADRGVDRREAVSRAHDVTGILQNVGNPVIVARMITKYSLALMQNVDSKTIEEMQKAVNDILGEADTPIEIKIDIIALKLGVIVGPDVMAAAIDAINARLAANPKLGSNISAPPNNPDLLKKYSPAPPLSVQTLEKEMKV